MKQPELSIIIPTCNSGSHLSESLDSIINQTFKTFEIIIFDNLSTDCTLEIIKRYASLYKNIRWFSEGDSGIYDAMNKGIKFSEGEWIYFMGSDDRFYDDNVLDLIFNSIKGEKIIYGNVLINQDAGWAKDKQIYDGEFSLSKLIKKNICQQAIFYNKTVFEKCGNFSLSYNICSDWDMHLHLWSCYPFNYFDTIITVFKGGNSSYKIISNYSEIQKWINIIKYFKINVLSSKFSEFSQNFLMIGKYFFKKKDYLKSVLLVSIFALHKIRKH